MIRSVKEYVQMPLLYNHWYVAGTTDEFSANPTGRILLEHALVFYRTAAGELTALQDRCLHRSYPLSESQVIDDQLVCGYHGARYNAEGEVMRIPCQQHIPKRNKLRKYPIKELGPLVFIWMGESEPDYDRLPSMPHLIEPNFRYTNGFFEIKGSYVMMGENLHDLTHFPYLHSNTFGFDDSYLEIERITEKTEDGLVRLLNVEDDQQSILRQMPPKFGKNLAASGSTLKMTDETIAYAPGIVKVHQVFLRDDEDTVTDDTLQGYVTHFMTPIDKQSCYYWYVVGYNFGTDEDDYFNQMLPKILRAAFQEDVDAVEKMQFLLDKDKIDFKEMSIAGDKAGILFRNVMLGWAKEEYGDNVADNNSIAVTQIS